MKNLNLNKILKKKKLICVHTNKINNYLACLKKKKSFSIIIKTRQLKFLYFKKLWSVFLWSSLIHKWFKIMLWKEFLSLPLKCLMTLESNLKIVTLNITFSHKNTFLTIADCYGEVLRSTTVRREGHIGYELVEASSLLNTVLLFKKYLFFFKRRGYRICLKYSGWSTHIATIEEALFSKRGLKKKKGVTLKYAYIKYVIKIPHNGCRLKKWNWKQKKARHELNY